MQCWSLPGGHDGVEAVIELLDLQSGPVQTPAVFRFPPAASLPNEASTCVLRSVLRDQDIEVDTDDEFLSFF